MFDVHIYGYKPSVIQYVWEANLGRKIFVSYKYADDQVRNLGPYENSTVRDYIDYFEGKVDSSDDIYKGERDGEDLSHLSEGTIWEKLKKRIYDSSVTVVFISPGMRELGKPDRDQWIPWEISYSLKETSRSNKNGDAVTSHSNAMIAVVLPDSDGSYSYYLESKFCCANTCTIHHTGRLFEILRKNMFNRWYNASSYICSNDCTIWNGTHSYIEPVRWDDFINDYQYYVDKAIERQNHIDEYEICKTVSG